MRIQKAKASQCVLSSFIGVGCLVYKIIVGVLMRSGLVRCIKKCNLFVYRKFLRFVGLSKDDTSRNLFRLFQFALSAVLVIFITNFFSLLKNDWDWDLGSFGDYFGGMLNPILTFMTFMGLLVTIVLQQRELGLTRNELSISSKALSEQAETQEKQRFESTFFSLFEQHNKILFMIDEPRQGVDGREGSSYWWKVYGECFSSSHGSLKTAKYHLEQKNMLVGHYFRTLYQLLKLIATKHPGSEIGLDCDVELLRNLPVTNEEKFYSNLVRSVLFYEVLHLLAVNCFSDDDSYVKFKELVVRYQFFEHMPLTYAGRGSYHPVLIEAIEYFGERAFGDSQFLNGYKKHMPTPSLFE